MPRLFWSLVAGWLACCTAGIALAEDVVEIKFAESGDRTVELAGEWRLLLPAGFEYAVKVTPHRDGYRLETAGIATGGPYDVRGEKLVYVGTDERQRYEWKIISPYMLALGDHDAANGADYSGAVMFRLSPAATLRLQGETTPKPSGSTHPSSSPKTSSNAPPATVASLNALVKAGDYLDVRQKMRGHEVEGIATVESNGKWLQVKLEPEAWWSASLMGWQNFEELKPGDRIEFHALILEEGYGNIALWVRSWKKLGEVDATKPTPKPSPSEPSPSEPRAVKQPDDAGLGKLMFHSDLSASALKVNFDVRGEVSQQGRALILPLTITNASSHKFRASVAHEWPGGIWPPTALYASVTCLENRNESPAPQPFLPVYVRGEDVTAIYPTEVAGGASLRLPLRMNWPGTGSMPALPLIEKPGSYRVQFALVIEELRGKTYAGKLQYVVSQPFAVTWRGDKPEPAEDDRPAKSSAGSADKDDPAAPRRANAGGLRLRESKVVGSPLGFSTLAGALERWDAVDPQQRWTGELSQKIAWDKIERIHLLQLSMHLRDMADIDGFLKPALASAQLIAERPDKFPGPSNSGHYGVMLQVLLELKSGDHALVTIGNTFPNWMVIEYEGRIGLAMLKR